MIPIVIGIDLGGTNVRVGAVTLQGELLTAREAPIEAARGPQLGLTRIMDLIDGVQTECGDAPLLGIGIGCTGPVDREHGMVQNPYTLPTWENVDILRPLTERYRVPATLENDADAAALGEAWMGAGKGVERLAAVTVGTGIGTAFIYRGQIYRGFEGYHGEGGHILLDPNGPECYCGARGCWEMLAAGPAIALQAREVAAAEPTRMLDLAGGELDKITAFHLAQAAREGDPAALRLAERIATYLAWGMVNLITLLMPDCVVLGGGVIESFDVFEPTFRRVLYRHNVMAPIERVRIERARLGSRAGMLGAARAILNLSGEFSHDHPFPLH